MTSCCCPFFWPSNSRSYAVEHSDNDDGNYTLLGPRYANRGGRLQSLWRQFTRPFHRLQRHLTGRPQSVHGYRGLGDLSDFEVDADFYSDSDGFFGAKPFGTKQEDYGTPLQHQTPTQSRRQSSKITDNVVLFPSGAGETKPRSHSIAIHTTRVGKADEKYDNLVDVRIDAVNDESGATGTTPSSLASEAITFSSIPPLKRDAQLMSVAEIQALLSSQTANNTTTHDEQ